MRTLLATLVSFQVPMGVDWMFAGEHRKTILPGVQCVEFHVTGLRYYLKFLKTQQSFLDSWRRFFIEKSVGC